MNRITSISSRFLLVFAFASLFCFGGARQADAAISSFTAAPVGSAIAGQSDADYDFTFETDNATPTQVITVAFPSGYSIQNGVLGGTGDGPIANAIQDGVVTVGVTTYPVVQVVGNSGARSITITMSDFHALNGAVVSFRLLKGITNPNTPGSTTEHLLVSTLPSGESQETSEGVFIDYAASLSISAPSDVAAGVPFDVEVCSSNGDFSGTITLEHTSLSDGTLSGTLSKSASPCATFTFTYVADNSTPGTITFTATASGQESDTADVDYGTAPVSQLSLENQDGGTAMLIEDGEVASHDPVGILPGAPVTLEVTRHLPGATTLSAAKAAWGSTAYRFNTGTGAGTTYFCIAAPAHGFNLTSLGSDNYKLTYVITNTPISPLGVRNFQMRTYTQTDCNAGASGSSEWTGNGGPTLYASALEVVEEVAITDPVEVDDRYEVQMNTAWTLAHTPNTVTGNVLDNDAPVADIGPRTAVLDAGPAYGDSFTLNSDGSFSYTPQADIHGPVSFTYHVAYTKTNGQPGASNTATASIVINGGVVYGLTLTNQAEGSVNLLSEHSALPIAPGAPVELNLTMHMTGDWTEQWNSTAYRFNSSTGVGTTYFCVARTEENMVNLGGDLYRLTHTITQTPISPAGVRNFFLRTYESSDCDAGMSGSSEWTGNGGPAIYTTAVDVEPASEGTPDVSIGQSDSVSTYMGSATSGNVLSNDNIGSVSTASAIGFSDPAHGTLSETTTEGAFTYTPDSGYHGSDSFTYQIQWTRTNGQTGTTDPITVSVSVSNGSGDDGDHASYITSCVDLQNINSTGLGKYYRLYGNIDCTYDTQDESGALYNEGAGFLPIGTGSAFTGTFDGDGYVITGLKIYRPSTQVLGLFATIQSPGSVTDLGIEDVSVTGTNYLGGLAGYNFGGTITKSYVTGSVSGADRVGGVVGLNDGYVTNSYAIASVSGSQHVGGLVGYNNTYVQKSYAAGPSTGTNNVGGVVGTNLGTVTDSFYDQQTTGQIDTGRGTPKTTAQMKTKATFTNANWDFSDIWDINNVDSEANNDGYPFLDWQDDFSGDYTSTRSTSGLTLSQEGSGSVDLLEEEGPLAIAPGSPVTLELTMGVTGDDTWGSTAYRFATYTDGGNHGIGTTAFCVARDSENTVDNEDGTYTLTYSITNTPISPTGVRAFYVRTYASANCDAEMSGSSEWTGNGGPTIYQGAINVTTESSSGSGETTIVAEADSYATPLPMGDALVVTTENDLLSNDTIPGDVSASAVLVDGQGPQHGTLLDGVIGTDGTFTYTPDSGYLGDDTFQYRIQYQRTNGQTAYSSPVTVTLTVSGRATTALTLTNQSSVAISLLDEEREALPIAPGAPVTLNLTMDVTGEAEWGSTAYRFNRTSAIGTTAFCVVRTEGNTTGSDGSYTLTYSIPNTPVTPTGTRYFQVRTYASSNCDGLPPAPVGSGQAGAWTGNGGPDLYADAINVTTESTSGEGTTVFGADDSYATPLPMGTALEVASGSGVLANDTANGVSVTAASYGDGPSHGYLTLGSDGSFTYTPDSGYVGTDSFQYRLAWTKLDTTTGYSDPVTVTLTVSGRATSGLTLTNQSSASVNLLDTYAPISIAPGAPVTLALTQSVAGDGEWGSTAYRFNRTSAIGTTAFCVARDSENTVDNEDGTYTLTYGITNTPINPAGTRYFQVRTYASANCDGLPPAPVGSGQAGAWTGNGGPDLYADAINVTTESAESGEPTIVGAADEYEISMGSTLSGSNVLSNDTLPGGVPGAQVVLFEDASHGTLTLGAGGSVEYVPDSGFHGEDGFSYRIAWTKLDTTTGYSSPIAASITVTGSSVEGLALTNQSSTSVNLLSEHEALPIAPGAPVTLNLTLGITGDVDDIWNSTAYRFNSGTGAGTTYFCVARGENTVDNEDGTYTLTYSIPNTPISPAGIRNFFLRTYASNDCSAGMSGSSEWTGNGGPTMYGAAVNVTTESAGSGEPTLGIADDATVAMNTAFANDKTFSGNVLTNDNAGSVSSAQAISFSDPENGELTSTGTDGSFTYKPDVGFHGTDTFTYQVAWTRTNGQTGTTEAITVTVMVEGRSVESLTLSRNGTATTTLVSGNVNQHPDNNGSEAYEDTLAIAPGAPVTLTLSVDVTGESDWNSIGYRFAQTSGSNNGVGSSFTCVARGSLTEVSEGTYAYAIANTPISPEGLRNFYLRTFSDGCPGESGSLVTNQQTKWTGTGGPVIYWQSVDVTNADAPGLIAVNDYGYSVAMNGELEGASVLANDAPASSPRTASLVGEGTTLKGGSVELGSDGTFTYVPASGFHGIDTFQYQMNYQRTNGTPEVSNTATVVIAVGTTVNSADFDFSAYEPTAGDGQTTVTIPESITLTANSSTGTAVITIPANTNLSTNSESWNGIIDLQPVDNSSVSVTPSSGTTATVVSAISIGLPETAMSFSKAVRISFPGNAGKLVGWTRGGSFTQISSVCGQDDQDWADDHLASDGDCKITVGDDLVVWTKHLTTYVVYTEAAIPSTRRSSSGGGGSSGQSVRTTTTTSGTSGQQASSFTRDLQVGSSGEDVRQLQRFLNTHGYPVALSGPGSLDNETNLFGGLTRDALAKFQAANGITPAAGYFGSVTRAFIANMMGGLAAPTVMAPTETAPAPTAPVTGLTVRDLDVGMSGDDVRALQTLLMAQGYAIPAGATGYFAGQTKSALAAYQAAHGITPAVGYFGEKTRAQMKGAGLEGLWW